MTHLEDTDDQRALDSPPSQDSTFVLALRGLVAIEGGSTPEATHLVALQKILHAFLDGDRQFTAQIHTQATSFRKDRIRKGKALKTSLEVHKQKTKGFNKSKAVQQAANFRADRKNGNPIDDADVRQLYRDLSLDERQLSDEQKDSLLVQLEIAKRALTRS